MFLTRSVGNFLRGKATPGQLFVAALLGGMLGFLPTFFAPNNAGGGFAQAPGLILSLLFLPLVLNVNLALVGLVAIIAKLLSLMLLPVSFAIGRVLLDGPLQPLFQFLVNAPVTAWLGLEYYATTGGLVLGALFGAVAGLGSTRLLASLRRRMTAPENPSADQSSSIRGISKFFAWLLLGRTSGDKIGGRELMERHGRALGIRPLGLLIVLLVTTMLFAFQNWFSTPLLTEGLRSGLMIANGATVDLESAEVDLSDGALRITNLAMADSADLMQDSFAAARLEASIDTGALLRRRFVIDKLRAIDASTGGRRQTPGQLTATGPDPVPPVPAGNSTIEDYVGQARLWRARIRQVRRWLEYCAGSTETPDQRTVEQEQRELDEQIRRHGLARVTAGHLREEWPLIWVRSVEIDGIECAWLPGESLHLRGNDLSSGPWLLSSPPQLSIATDTDKLEFDLTGRNNKRAIATLDFSLRRLAVDDVFRHIRVGGAAPVREGTLDLTAHGELLRNLGQTTVDLPIQVELHDTVFAIAGSPPTPVEHLVLPIGVHGRADDPTISLHDAMLTNALIQAGKRELADFVRAQGGALLRAVPGAELVLDPNKSAEQLLEGGKEALQHATEAGTKQALEEARKRAEAAAKKRLRGILPGGK